MSPRACPGVHGNTNRLMTGWSAGLTPCVTPPHGHRPVAGLGFSVTDNPGSDVQSLLPARTLVPLPARPDDRQPSGEEKECTAICQHLLPWMKVAVRAAKQDARSVHIRLARARARRHTERARPGLDQEIRGAFAPGWQREREGPWRTFCAMTRFAAMTGRLVPGRAAGPGIRDGVAGRCGSR